MSLIILFYMFSFIVTSSVLLNFAALFLMMKDKGLRRHSQYLMFMIISSTEIVIDIFYLCLFYWNKTFVYICHMLLIVLTIGRNNVFFHLMYLCIERLCAITVSLQKVFQILINSRNRVIFLGISLFASAALLIPSYFLYDRTERPEACMVQSLFQENGKFVLMYIRTVYCIELLIVCLIYFQLTRKIKHLMVSVSPVVNNAGMNSIDIPPSANHKVNDLDNCNAETQEQTVGISSQKKAPKLQGNRNGLAWKIRAFKFTQATILATVIPSSPMAVLQIVGYIKPDLLSKRADLVISMSNTAHAVIFPLVFIATVKKLECCKK